MHYQRPGKLLVTTVDPISRPFATVAFSLLPLGKVCELALVPPSS